MTGQQSRPAVEPGGQENLAATKILLDAEHAHLFGVGMSHTARAATNRRVFAQFGATLEPMMRQAARRLLVQTVSDSLPESWLRRAETFEAVGSSTADDSARVCRQHAFILATAGLPDGIAAEIDDFLAEGVA